MPYRVQKPHIVVDGRRFVSPGAVPQRLPFCDRCSELAASHAGVYTEVALDRWWKWFSYPRFSCQPEALMGCERHPVQAEIRFLDGHVEPFTRMPLARWRRLTERDVILAAVLAVVFAVIVEGVAILIHG
jgi:hypothetical protein